MESGPPSSSSAENPDRYDASSAHAHAHGLGSLLAAADIASFHVRPDGTITDVNDAFTVLTGYNRSELLGAPFSTVVVDGEPSLGSLVGIDGAGGGEDDAEGGENEAGEASETDADAEADGFETGPISTTLSIRTKADTRLTADLHLERIETEGGETRIGGIVDRQPSAAESVSDSDLTYGRTFQALADALPDGIIVLDTNSDVQYANPAVERILGYSPDELVGSSKVNIIPPRLRQAHLDALQRYLETGERNLNWTYVELPGQHEAGHEVPLGVSLNDFFYDGDRYFVGLFRDISPRKEAEQTLTTKVAQLESVSYLGRHALEDADIDELLEKATELVVAALDAEYAAVFEHEANEVTSPDAETLRLRAGTGFDPGDETTAPVADSIAAAALADDDVVVIEDLASDDRFDGPSLVDDPDVRSGITVTVGSATDPWGVLDVYDTEQREFADHDVDFIESVATIIANAIERDRYERRLNETVDELEASNERLEQFAYAASHDLQEPLRMISSYLQLLEGRYADELDSDGEEFIEFAVDGAERMREMIEGLLEYSRIDTQGDPFEPVDLDAVLEDVLTDLQVMIEQSDAEITAEPLPELAGDPSQLRQLFQNLLSNAIEYSGDEPPRVYVAVERTDGMWTFSVRDEGIGIDSEEPSRVFEVFQRLHAREKYDGTGIGLALCQRIVERHGGEIWVESEPGEGTTFTFTLPRR
ncbi:PAS domain S-box protein [Natronorubrum sp. JWXQ-INN-674]|uniref:histidine kinase n=1 Tax=Natronorubrum halalkaliphilum TaxID=2691917 RepID=A0A6B0VPV3_9EURY|nr:PAS domain S-box protein [Natronorubrum halalkaliphilum]MXV63325.1 PAS domain S-box protein [Natronorubrum halalkaliphilum]